MKAASVILLSMFVVYSLAKDDVHIHVDIGKEKNKNEADYLNPPDNEASSAVTEASKSGREETHWIGSYSVNCGGHRAVGCWDCPQGHGRHWCNGECIWYRYEHECGSVIK